MSYSVFVICTRIVRLISGCGTVAGWHGEHESGHILKSNGQVKTGSKLEHPSQIRFPNTGGAGAQSDQTHGIDLKAHRVAPTARTGDKKLERGSSKPNRATSIFEGMHWCP